LGAVIYLVPEGWQSVRRKFCHFNKSMDLLQANWRPNNKYPIILLNTRKWETIDMREIRRKWSSLDILFSDVSEVFKKPFTSDDSPYEEKNDPGALDYKKMIRFFIQGITEVELLQQYKYLMRIDDDGCIEDPINYDIFHEMKLDNAYYAYRSIFSDPPHVTTGLYDFVKNYTRDNDIAIANEALHEAVLTTCNKGTYPAFSSNIEIIDLERYMQPDIMHFIGKVKPFTSTSKLVNIRYNEGDGGARCTEISMG
jgi:hypothetical protein